MTTDLLPERSQEGGGAPTRANTRLHKAWHETRHFRPVLGLTLILFIFFCFDQSVFFTGQNLKNLLTAVSVLWVVSIGMTFVLLTGGVDLSVGGVGALAAIMLSKLLALGLPGGVCIVLVCLGGALVGTCLNGVLIGRVGLSFFVVTLGTMTALSGVVSLWSHDQSVFVTNPTVINIGTGQIAGMPTSIWIMIVTLLVGAYVLRRTYFGRDVYAVGGSLPAARLSGVRVSFIGVAVYGISGLCAALGGVIAAGQIGAASPTPNATLPLQAAAAVLLGGTSLAGGSGGLAGTAFGVLFIGVLQNGLSIAGVSSFWQDVVTGVILIAAVLGDRIGSTGGFSKERLAVMRRRALGIRRQEA
jgi:ribose transport system permease protein